MKKITFLLLSGYIAFLVLYDTGTSPASISLTSKSYSFSLQQGASFQALQSHPATCNTFIFCRSSKGHKNKTYTGINLGQVSITYKVTDFTERVYACKNKLIVFKALSENPEPVKDENCSTPQDLM